MIKMRNYDVGQRLLIATELINYTRILVLPGVEQEEAKRMRIGARCIVLDLLMMVSASHYYSLLF